DNDGARLIRHHAPQLRPRLPHSHAIKPHEWNHEIVDQAAEHAEKDSEEKDPENDRRKVAENGEDIAAFEHSALEGATEWYADNQGEHDPAQEHEAYPEDEISVRRTTVQLPAAADLRIALQHGVKKNETEACGDIEDHERESNADRERQEYERQVLCENRSQHLLDILAARRASASAA